MGLGLTPDITEGPECRKGQEERNIEDASLAWLAWHTSTMGISERRDTGPTVTSGSLTSILRRYWGLVWCYVLARMSE